MDPFKGNIGLLGALGALLRPIGNIGISERIFLRTFLCICFCFSFVLALFLAPYAFNWFHMLPGSLWSL